MFGFYRTAAAVPQIKVADVGFNSAKIIDLISQADKNTASIVVFPELSLTGYTCGDLFHQSALLDKVYETIPEIAEVTAKKNIISVIGAPLRFNGNLYNCAVVLHRGKIKGVVPKSYNPNYREFYEKRWFKSGLKVRNSEMEINGYSAPFGTDLIFECGDYFRFAIEICEDLWSIIPPSSYYSAAGANVILNLSASNELVSKSVYRKELIKQQSGRCIAGYVYASSGVHESTTDLVFGGHAIIAENGTVIAENERFQREDSITYGEIDGERLFFTRVSESSFSDSEIPEGMEFRNIKLDGINDVKNLNRKISPQPFVPSSPEQRNSNCLEIFSIQSAGLAKRFEHTGLKKAVVGISGGLDSTLALLVCAETFKLLGKKNSDIIAVTMPGFGTSDRTYKNAVSLCRILKTDLREINIQDDCLSHFKAIGHNPAKHDITYENVQARERTQLLMDIANKEGGLVIGTGDLSEIALGWSTYNGDHMSMYAVNCSVPKTLIRYLIKWVAENSDKKLRDTLEDIINTPVSPELLPKSEKDDIVQKTEELIGPYELHDFFLYHTVKYGASPDKIRYLAKAAFAGKYKASEIDRVLKIFIKRFFAQQFKRSCIPDGPKVGTISLSPRGDWRMPSDASDSVWN
ncbi:MAG: NAD(+) synthase [Lentisphaerae bacterium GWF2_44_16]|nr:MAG: NAD(+) synthase [Lentisphaerae bacterium GWF2_44_16]